jgi:hypothetical protein
VSSRAQRLHETADGQIVELIALLAAAGDADLDRPCPGRDKLGDGSVGAVATLMTGNSERIAQYLAGGGHVPGNHAGGTRAAGVELVARLAVARDALAAVAGFPDERLDSVPAAGEMRFADGERTLEQVVASMLKHQQHQIDAVASALA